MTINQITWIVHLFTSYYFIQRIRNREVRLAISILTCMLLTRMSCSGLPKYEASSLITVSLCWMMSLRIIQLVVFPAENNCSFWQFVLKPFWTIVPLVPRTANDKQEPILLYFLWGIVKLVGNHWIVRWLITCQPVDSYLRIIMICFMVLTSSYIQDIQNGIVRLITRDKYGIQTINQYPLLSTSVREFWGKRYNRLAGSVFRECVFRPLHDHLCSPEIASLVTFFLSGLLHAHINVVVLDDITTIYPTVCFFILNSIFCSIEKKLLSNMSVGSRWLCTFMFLLLTLPLFVSSYSRQGSMYFEKNVPPLFDSGYIPYYPVENLCFS